MTMTEQQPTVENPFSDEVLERYRVWKKNAAFFYDSFISAPIPWPSLTVQWFPDVEKIGGKQTQRLLLGTQTCGQGDEFLRLASITRGSHKADPKLFDTVKNEFGRYDASAKAKLDVNHKINHSVGEVNRARFMPQNCDLIATFASNGRAYIFDRSKHSLDPSPYFKAEMVLDLHSEEGFGLSWNPHQEGLLLTASDSIALWDVTKYKREDKGLAAQRSWKDHLKIVNEVEWHPHSNHRFVSVSDDCTLKLRDVRDDSARIEAQYTDCLNCVKFSPANEHIVAAGSSDSCIVIWDSRNLQQEVMKLSGHSGSLTSIQWNPHEPTVIASASTDSTAIIWDIAQEQPLLFQHGGHKGEVNDISWNPADTWELATVAGDNQVHVWRPAHAIVGKAV